ncbi:GNAT family N-acetyltransferase [Bryobacter aggregatus]|uniref:GNAT family N-acetyltransferase n=1 Tax=Bryobacter aggregatus TaxID=360054 RepID=UPI0004E13E36|nr:GNAT family N-acetyltransferase [Bryobacter aggregatus]
MQRVNFEPSAAAVMRSFAEASAGEWIDVAGGVAGYCGEGSPVNAVKGMSRAPVREELDQIIRFYFDRKMDALIEVAPWVEEASAALLQSCGFERVAVEDVMAQRSSAMERVEGVEECRDPEAWARLMSHSFFGGISELSMAVGRTIFHLGGSRSFGIWRDGEMVAGANILYPSGVALFAGDGTLQAHRGQGLQQRLIRDRMCLAFQAGSEWMHAEVEPGGGSQRNYQRCGFTVAYSRMHYRKPFPA